MQCECLFVTRIGYWPTSQSTSRRNFQAVAGELDRRLVSGDELIGHVVQVVADDMGLRSDFQNIVADTLDQRALPARRDGAESVPGVARNEAELRGLGAELILDISVSLPRRFMMLHAVRAEAALKQIDDAAMLELTGLNFKQIIGEGEEPETRIAKLT